MEIECNNSPERITHKILQEWLEGKGLKPVSWETLVNTLRDIGLNALADEIQSACGKERVYLVQIPPETIYSFETQS